MGIIFFKVNVKVSFIVNSATFKFIEIFEYFNEYSNITMNDTDQHETKSASRWQQVIESFFSWLYSNEESDCVYEWITESLASLLASKNT